MKIGLSKGTGFQLIPEGSHVFKITDVSYNADFGKVEIRMKTKEGLVHTERYKLLNNDGDPVEPALNAFSYFAKTAMNNFDLESIDHEELIGHYIECLVEHEKVESNKEPGKILTFIKLTEKKVANGFEGEDEVISVKKEGKAFDLDAILG